MSQPQPVNFEICMKVVCIFIILCYDGAIYDERSVTVMSERNLTLMTDLYELTMMQGYFENQSNERVVFDAFYRSNPSGSGYAICAGLEQVIEYVKNLHFSDGDIEYLRRRPGIAAQPRLGAKLHRSAGAAGAA